jgi:hypothetical protein
LSSAIENGKSYILFTDNDLSMRKKLLEYLHRKTDLILFYTDYSIFENHYSVKKLLEKNSFAEEEINKILNFLDLKCFAKSNQLDFFHKVILLINICLKRSSILIIHIAGMDYKTAQFAYNYIDERIKRNKEKAAVIIESYIKSKNCYLKEVPPEILLNYKKWMLSCSSNDIEK